MNRWNPSVILPDFKSTSWNVLYRFLATLAMPRQETNTYFLKLRNQFSFESIPCYIPKYTQLAI